MPSPIEVHILGRGSAIPTPQRKHPAVALRYEGECLLFDCGECAQLGLQKAGISPMKIKRIFITHWHADHFAGLLPLIETLHMLGREKTLYIYAPEASDFVDKMLQLSYLSFGFKIKPKNAPTEKKRKLVKTEKYSVYSLPTKHSVPSVAYIFKENSHWKINKERVRELGIPFEKLNLLKTRKEISIKSRCIKLKDVAEKIEGRKIVYSGDTEPLDSLFKEATNAILIHEATFKYRKDSGFFILLLKKYVKWLKKHDVNKLILLHFSRRYKNLASLEKFAKSIFEKAILARDGTRIVV